MKNNERTKKSPIVWIATIVGLGIFSICLAFGIISLFVENGRYKTKIENMYERAFFDVADSVNNVEISLSKLMVSQSRTQSAVIANDIWRQANYAQANLSQLPLEHDSVMTTTKFLNQAGDWCYSYSKALTNGIKSETADEDIENLYVGAKNINESIKDLGHKIRDSYKIMNHINSGRVGSGEEFKTSYDEMEKNSVDYPELIYDGPFSDSVSARCYKALENLEEISKEQVFEKFSDIIADKKVEKIELVGESQGIAPAYELQGKIDGNEIYASFSKNGGILLNLGSNKNVGAVKLNEKQATEFALKAVEKAGFDNMQAVWYNMIDGIAYINFAPVVNDITFYTDLVKVKLALDNGDILGIEAKGYCMNHCDRTYLATMNDKTARALVSSKLEIMSTKLAVVPKGHEEVLTYEICGEYKGLEYFIYLDAVDGEQINIMRVIDEDQGKMAM